MTFQDWLQQKFIEWEQTQPRRQTYSAFAKYLGTKQSTLSQWMNGNNPPSSEGIRLLAEKLGNEVYPLLGIMTPGETDDFAKFPPELQRAFLDAKGILQEMDSPTESESLTVINQALNKAGYRLISNTDDADAK